MKHLLLILCGVVLLPFATLAQNIETKNPAPAFHIFCVHLMQKQPSLQDYSAYFSTNYRRSMSIDQLTTFFSKLTTEVGICNSSNVIQKDDVSYQIVLGGSKNKDVILDVVINKATGLFESVTVQEIVDHSILKH